MPSDDINAGFRDELTDSEWEMVAKVLMYYCRSKVLPYLRDRMRLKNSDDAEDVLMAVLEETLMGLRDGRPPYFSEPRKGETRAQVVESLHAMCRGSEPQPVPSWLENRVFGIAKRRAIDFVRKRAKQKAEVSVEEADAIDEHAPPDEDAANREEFEWQEGQLADALSQLPIETQMLVAAWLDQPSREAEKAFLGQLQDSDKDRLRNARKKLRRNLEQLRSLESRDRGTEAQATAALLDGKVNFTVTSPDALPVGNASLVDVWVHLASQQGRVLSLAASVRDPHTRIAGSKGPVSLARGTQLEIQLNVPSCEVRPVEDTVCWSGRIANATFAVTVPMNTGCESLACEAIVRVHGLSIARIAFVLIVGTTQGALGVVNARVKRNRRAFVSYAREDKEAMWGRIQGMMKRTPDLDVFVDQARLKSGERWPQRLREEIVSRDVLYLFWSKAASESKWVEKEWRCAYNEKGVDFIDPVPLVSPEIVAPPKELAELHFDDWMLAFTRGR